jgi:DNA-binding response OmpR family regulator
MRFLIVDDQEATAEMMAISLGTLGHSADFVLAEPAARVAIWSHAHDAVILDWWLAPGAPGGGMRLLQWMRMSGDRRPVAMMTASAPADFAEVHAAAVALDAMVFYKPFDPDGMAAALAAAHERNVARV